MSYECLLASVVVVAFSSIHFIEMASFIARIAGVRGNSKALAYSLQNAVYMLTRFFSMLMLPVLGLLVDYQVPKKSYVFMVSMALLSAFSLSALVFLFRGRFISAFSTVIDGVKAGQSLLVCLVRFPVYLLISRPVCVKGIGFSECARAPLLWGASLIFSIYAVSLFVSFYFGLIFPEYRASITQLSGVTNAFATVLLTFYAEPKISLAIDKEEEAEKLLTVFLIGRLVGVGVISQVVILTASVGFV